MQGGAPVPLWRWHRGVALGKPRSRENAHVEPAVRSGQGKVGRESVDVACACTPILHL